MISAPALEILDQTGTIRSC